MRSRARDWEEQARSAGGAGQRAWRPPGAAVRPVDPRLLRYSRAARGYLVFTVGLGLVALALVLAQAGLLAPALAAAARGTRPAALRGTLLALLAVVVARAAATYAGQCTPP